MCTCLNLRDVPSSTEILKPLKILLSQHMGAGKIIVPGLAGNSVQLSVEQI